MTHRNGIPKRRTGRRLVALAAAIGLLAASLLMPPAMAAASADSATSQIEMQAGHDHAGQDHADRHKHERQTSDSSEPSGCGLCSDCALCTMTIPITVGALPTAGYPPARLRIINTSLLPGIAPPPPAEPPRV